MYQPTLESLRSHPIPAWYDDAKLGIFIHWGLFSVPAWAPLTGELSDVGPNQGWDVFFRNNPYAEWYLNSLRIEGSPTHRHHVAAYGEAYSYDNFAAQFNQAIATWDPEAWADLFQKIGARYVVLVTKHHDGFLLWPSKRPNPLKPGFSAGRDIVGELSAAVRRRGMKMGFYYSGGLDWSFNPTPVTDRDMVYATINQDRDFIDYVDGHFRELIDDYDCDVLWNDIGYPVDAPIKELFAHFYNTRPDGVINDRFGQVVSAASADDSEVVKNPDAIHFDFTTPEYSAYKTIKPFKWESNRGIGYSFGYNQQETPETYLSAAQAIRSFIDIVSKNGNLLLNVGPMADGAIHPLQLACLEGLGAWLRVNGEAIFDTRPWREADGCLDDGTEVRYTQRDDTLYATLLAAPRTPAPLLTRLRAAPETTVRLLGRDGTLTWQQEAGGLRVHLPELPAAVAYALAITPQPELS